MKSPPLRSLILAIMITAPAMAGEMPPEIATRLKELGPVIDVPKTAAIYAPLQQREPYQGVKVERDIAYGPADLNRLDVFTPEGSATAPRPVLIFVRGGGFVAGDKHAPGSPFYDNVMLAALKDGFVGVNINYRLAPQAPWPAGAEDVAAAVKWAAANIATRGGNPARIILMGHSAGATHVATYVSHREFQDPRGDLLAGAILVSGLYDLTTLHFSDFERAYYGTDASTYKDKSSIEGLIASKTPLLLAHAGLDPVFFIAQFGELKDRLCSSPRGCARTVVLPEHAHISELYAMNSGDTSLSDQIVAFVKELK